MSTSFLCECGCGESAPIATIANRKKGKVKGQSQRFVRGHNSRVANGHVRIGPDHIVDENGCWIWQHGQDGNGYGKVWNGERSLLAHRHYYEQHIGGLDPRMALHHLCATPACVNPAHLQVVTHGYHSRLHHARLHWDQVREIRESDLAPSALAERYGVAPCTISNIRAHRIWKEPVAA